MNRKELLLEDRDKRTLDDKEKTDKVINEGGGLSNMMETFGWKILYEGFILPNIEETRWLGASREDLADIRAEIRVLKALMKFIETRVKAANDLAVKIKK